MSPRTQTTLIVIAVVIGLIVWDVIVLMNNVSGDTISNVVFSASQHAAAIPYACGCLCVHWFWPMRKHLMPTMHMISILLAGAVLISVGGWMFDRPEWWGLLSLVTGGAAGRLWPNSVDGKDA